MFSRSFFVRNMWLSNMRRTTIVSANMFQRIEANVTGTQIPLEGIFYFKSQLQLILYELSFSVSMCFHYCLLTERFSPAGRTHVFTVSKTVTVFCWAGFASCVMCLNMHPCSHFWAWQKDGSVQTVNFCSMILRLAHLIVFCLQSLPLLMIGIWSCDTK